MEDARTLLLIRHAAVSKSHQVLWGRTPGVRLSHAGRRSAARLALMLSGSAVEEVLSSPRRRAMDTSRLIAAPARVPVRIDARLDEFDFGEWTGRPLAALGKDPAWQRFTLERATGAAPGGETIEEVRRRVGAAVDDAFASRRALVVMITHAEIIRLALLDLLGRSPDEWADVPIDPGSISVVQGTDRHTARVCAINQAKLVLPRCGPPPCGIGTRAAPGART